MSLAFSPSFKVRANMTMDMKLSVNAPKQKAARICHGQFWPALITKTLLMLEDNTRKLINALVNLFSTVSHSNTKLSWLIYAHPCIKCQFLLLARVLVEKWLP
jgi:hypothetical protein